MQTAKGIKWQRTVHSLKIAKLANKKTKRNTTKKKKGRSRAAKQYRSKEIHTRKQTE